jgi:hypothetical protein
MAQSIEIRPNQTYTSTKKGPNQLVINSIILDEDNSNIVASGNSKIVLSGEVGATNGSYMESGSTQAIEFNHLFTKRWSIGDFYLNNTLAEPLNAFQIRYHDGSFTKFPLHINRTNTFIGLNTMYPLTKLHFQAGASDVNPFANTTFFIENNNHNYLHMGAADGFDNGILFSNTIHNPSFGGSIQYKADNRMLFQTNAQTRILISSSGNVGIGTSTPNAKLDVNGDVVIRKKTLLPITTQTVNNFDRNGASVICTGTPAASAQTITITGIAGGVDGMMIWIYPTQNFTIRLENENVGSIAVNRIRPISGTGDILTSRGGATLIYDGTQQRWQVIDAN